MEGVKYKIRMTMQRLACSSPFCSAHPSSYPRTWVNFRDKVSKFGRTWQGKNRVPFSCSLFISRLCIFHGCHFHPLTPLPPPASLVEWARIWMSPYMCSLEYCIRYSRPCHQPGEWACEKRIGFVYCSAQECCSLSSKPCKKMRLQLCPQSFRARTRVFCVTLILWIYF